jgi:SNF2-related domain/Helicase conserved C-terminal domain
MLEDLETEAYKTLLARVGRKSPKIPADLLVRHVLRVVPASEWPVRVEAMDAVLRRVDSVKKDGLGIGGRPSGGSPLGVYSTKRRGSGARPYSSAIFGVDPIEARCDCPDFLKNSLAICKHVLIILEFLHARPKVLKRAMAEQDHGRSGLLWDPVRPLEGQGDWLARVTLVRPPDAKAPKATREARALEWFRPGDEGIWSLANSYIGDPSKRLALVEDIGKLLPQAERSRQDPSLVALLEAERDRLRQDRKRTLDSTEIREAIKGLKRTLYPYQKEGVERFLSQGRLLLADDMGLGKTAQAISCTDILWRSRRIRKGLIIAPASLKPQWAREWASFSDLPILVVDGSPTERKALYESTRSGLFIINYEQLIRDLEWIRAWSPDLVVLDEAQRIKNWATKTALSVKGLSPPYRLVLTGTPMENRIDELASVVEWVDDMALEPKWRLSSLHAIHADGKREVTGVRNLETLRERLRPCMLRRVRQDVLEQLPARTDTRVPIEMTGEQQGAHDDLIQPIIALIQRAKTRPLTQVEFLRLMSLLTTQRIISNGMAQLDFEEVWPAIRPRHPEESVLKGLSSPKLLEIRQLIRQLVLEQGRKVVVFSQWRRMLTLAHWAVGELLAEGGFRAGFFTGAEGQKRRTQNIVEFHDDPTMRILFASDAGGVGLNLQHASNCVINMELPWNPAVLEQRIGRIYRLGQKQPIDVFNLVCEQGIESRIASLVGSKQAFFKGLFDGESDSVQFDQSASFLNRVEKIYETVVLPGGTPLDGGEGLEDGEPADELIDDEVGDVFDEIIEAADESDDRVAALPEAEPAIGDVAQIPNRPETAAQASGADPGSEVRRLFSKLTIRKESDGRVVLEAPPEAASALGALFEGMAALLQSASRTPESNGDGSS